MNEDGDASMIRDTNGSSAAVGDLEYANIVVSVVESPLGWDARISSSQAVESLLRMAGRILVI